jgi:uncharacterized protein GlcG (DUF336 family)
MTRLRLSALALFALTSTSASAQVLQERNISLSAAIAVAQGAVEACAAKNFNVTATVVDRAGIVRAQLRADRAGPHTVEASRRKAFTSASARNGTSAMLEMTGTNPAARNLGQIDGFLLVGGGVPIKAGDDVIGAVSVGGAPGGHLDDECANAGITKAADKLK